VLGSWLFCLERLSRGERGGGEGSMQEGHWVEPNPVLRFVCLLSTGEEASRH